MWTYLPLWQSLFSMEMKTDNTYGTTVINDYYIRKQGLDQNRFNCELSMDVMNQSISGVVFLIKAFLSSDN